MTTEEIKEYDVMCGAAHVYHTSAVFLQDMSSIVTTLIKAYKQQFDLNSNIITAIFLYALSAEIAIRAILKRDGSNVPRQHDLKSLFNSLSDERQKEIKGVVADSDFDTYLETNKNNFVDCRYFYEEENKTADISFLRNFSLALNNMINLPITLSFTEDSEN